MRLLIILIAIGLVYYIAKKTLQQLTKQPEKATSQAEEKILACKYCGIHVPVSEGIQRGEHFFCQQQHLEEWLKSNPPSDD